MQNNQQTIVRNLRSSTSRRSSFDFITPKAKKTGLPIFRISGIDGKYLTSEDLNKFVDKRFIIYNFPVTIGKGAVGCSLSHIKAWKTFLESPFQYALIMEDDINFDPTILATTLKLLEQNSDLWDINTFDTGRVGRGMPVQIKHFNSINKSLVTYLSKISYASAYIINRNAAQKLFEHALPIKLAVDHYFIRSWEFGLKFTGIEPRIILQDFGTSIIDENARIDKHIKDAPIKMLLLNKFFTKQTRFILRLYNLKIYLTLKAHQFFTNFCKRFGTDLNRN